MYASMQLKKRYIVFQVNSKEPVFEEDVKKGISSFLIKFFGEYGYSKLSYKFLQYDEKDKFGLVRCGRDSTHELLGAFALIEDLNQKKARVIALAVSGTIKTLREKGFAFIKGQPKGERPLRPTPPKPPSANII